MINNDIFYEEEEDITFYNDITFDNPSNNQYQQPNYNNNYYYPGYNAPPHQMLNEYQRSNEAMFASPPATMSSTTTRTASPAIAASAILINRGQPSPGTQKRPPHLRLNNL